MIRVIQYCRRCGKLISDKEYRLGDFANFPYIDIDPVCAVCDSEYYALKELQREELRKFWEESEDGGE